MKILPAIVAGLALALTPTAAGASVVRVPDGAGDAWVIVDSGAGESQPTEETTNVDLVGLKVNATRRALVVTASYADLVSGDDVIQLTTNVTTDRRARRMLNFWAGPGDRDGKVQVFKNNGGASACVGTRAAIDYDTDAVRFAVPLSCLAGPRWLRHQTFATALTDRGWFIDAAGFDSAEPEGWSAKLVAG